LRFRFSKLTPSPLGSFPTSHLEPTEFVLVDYPLFPLWFSRTSMFFVKSFGHGFTFFDSFLCYCPFFPSPVHDNLCVAFLFFPPPSFWLRYVFFRRSGGAFANMPVASFFDYATPFLTRVFSRFLLNVPSIVFSCDLQSFTVNSFAGVFFSYAVLGFPPLLGADGYAFARLGRRL